MAEKLVGRVKRLIAGSVNSMVDAVENKAPESVMKEAIREIDRAIDDVRSELGLVIANKHHANKRLMEAGAKHDDMAEKVRLAVGEGRDDLAEAAISRQIDLEAQIPVLEDAVKDHAEEEAELEGFIAALNGRRHEMEADLQSYLDTRPADGDVSRIEEAETAPDRRVEYAENAFNRVLRGATGVGASGTADADTASKLAELEKIARDNRVKERLAAFKAAK